MPDRQGNDYALSMDHTKAEDYRFALLRQAEYSISVTKTAQLPADEGAEVAIAGRSNAGKSSVLNRLTERRSLARVSRTPGRTQAINYFTLDAQRRLVDLPGYGYAKVPEALRRSWGPLLERYLRARGSLRGLVIVMDIRHPLGPHDADLIAFSRSCGRPVHVLLNKADKLSRGAGLQVLAQLRRETLLAEVGLQLFSAQTGLGLADLHRQLAVWLGEKETPTSAGAESESQIGEKDSRSGQGGRDQIETARGPSAGLE